MPLQKLQFRPGLNREGTDYSNEGGWYDGDKIRFRSGFPEKIGGWVQFSSSQFLGIARAIWAWLGGDVGSGGLYIGVGTSSKYYIYYGGLYNDVTPIVHTSDIVNGICTCYSTLSAAMTATADTLSVVSVTSFPTTGGIVLVGSEQIRYTGISANTLTGLTRGYNGTIPVTHTSGTPVQGYTVTVTDISYTPSIGDYIIFNTPTVVDGITLSGQYQVYGVIDTNHYTFNATQAATSAICGSGTIAYQFPSGSNVFTNGTGWGAGPWNAGSASDPWAHGWSTPYGTGVALSLPGAGPGSIGVGAGNTALGQQLRLWSNDNFGADLVIAPRGGPIYYWQSSQGVSVPAQAISYLANQTTAFSAPCTFASGVTNITVPAATAPYVYPLMAISGVGIPEGAFVNGDYVTGSLTVPISNPTTAASSGNYSFSYSGAYAPVATNQVVSSVIQEFIIAFGSNAYVPNNPATPFNAMLVRWCDQANPYQWIPQATNQSGEYLLTNGSYIMGARATRQEILVWTDSCLYSMQYLGSPYVWGFQVLMNNITVMSPNSMVTVNNVTYWMGRDRFYMYSGRVEVLPCALRQYIFADINTDQSYQIFCGSNNAFNEVWWFYVSESSGNTIIDKYVVYNYLDRNWYYGNMNRTAWFQSGIQTYPIAADYNGRLLNHEVGNDDVSLGYPRPINAYVQSSDFDIGDGHNFGFVWRILPDVNFNGSDSNQPAVTMTVKPRENSGTPYGPADSPHVQSAQNYQVLPQYTIQEFSGQVYTRLRGRQMSFRIESHDVGVAWQLGTPRIDIRPDGRR